MGLTTANRHKRRFGAVISIEDPHMRGGLRFHRDPSPPQLVLRFEDIDRDLYPYWVATMDDVTNGLAFARQNSERDILVHCVAGVSRSPALALAILADRLGPNSEVEAAEVLYELCPEAVPNLLILELADRFLQRGGAIVSAVLQREFDNPAARQIRKNREGVLQKNPDIFAIRPSM